MSLSLDGTGLGIEGCFFFRQGLVDHTRVSTCTEKLRELPGASSGERQGHIHCAAQERRIFTSRQKT